MQNVTKQCNDIMILQTCETTSLMGVIKKGADLRNFENGCVRLKAKEIVCNHCNLVEKVVFLGDMG